MKFEELQIYQSAMEIADKIRAIVFNWNYIAKDMVGKQLIKAADSVAANISEGFGRYFIKKINSFVIIPGVLYLEQKRS